MSSKSLRRAIGQSRVGASASSVIQCPERLAGRYFFTSCEQRMIAFRSFTSRVRRAVAIGLAVCAASTFALPSAFAADAMTDDPYLWLEDVSGARALDWARARNAAMLSSVAPPSGRELWCRTP